MEITAILIRKYDEDRTTGRLSVFIEKEVEVLHTLELPWKYNQKRISCIPEGKYYCRLRYSEVHGHHWILENVMNRSLILIHAGNFLRDTDGCILVGHTTDGKNVYESKKAMATLRKIIKFNSFNLYITS